MTSSQTNAFKGTKPFSGTNANHFDNRCKKARSTLTTYRLDTVQALEGTTQADENHRHIGGNSCTARIPRHTQAAHDRADQDLIAIFYWITEKPAALLVTEQAKDCDPRQRTKGGEGPRIGIPQDHQQDDPHHTKRIGD